MLYYLDQNTPLYPERFRQYLAPNAPAVITARGNLDILKQREMLSLFCSRKCPGGGAKKQLQLARTDRDQTFYTNKCHALDRQIDKLVYELYELTPEEIALVEAS